MENPNTEIEDDLKLDYDRASLGHGVRGKHYQEFQRGTNVAFLTPEVRAAFPTDQELNDALSLLIRVAKRDPSIV